MATFFRNLVRAGPSRSSPFLSRAFTAPSLPAFQSEPTSAPFTPTPNTRGAPFRPKNPYGLESAKPNPLTEDFAISDQADLKYPPSMTEYDESDTWWAKQSQQSKMVMPGNQWSGRSMRVYMSDTMKAYKQLSGMLSRSGVKKYVRRGEFHEKPSERKRRLGTERHRRRFQEMVREKVQTVQMIRNRG